MNLTYNLPQTGRLGQRR